MSNSFKILAGFLDRTEPEVQGRGLENPAPPVRLKLKQLARGELPESEHRNFFEQLDRNRHWIPVLAEEVKALRDSHGGQD